jgi:hypothetical protein
MKRWVLGVVLATVGPIRLGPSIGTAWYGGGWKGLLLNLGTELVFTHVSRGTSINSANRGVLASRHALCTAPSKLPSTADDHSQHSRTASQIAPGQPSWPLE